MGSGSIYSFRVQTVKTFYLLILLFTIQRVGLKTEINVSQYLIRNLSVQDREWNGKLEIFNMEIVIKRDDMVIVTCKFILNMGFKRSFMSTFLLSHSYSSFSDLLSQGP